MREEIDDIVRALPRKPGVYIMKDARGEVVYVGKATELRSRVRSYFGNSDPRPFVRLLDRVLADIDFVVTANPKEALLLENTLIKKHRPRFNFMLRDDKNYLSVRIRSDQSFPRVELVRSIRDDGARYFGPYHSASMARQTVTLINRYFHLRTCRDSVFRNRVRPCLQYQIHRCPAPCVLPVDREAYRDNIERAILLLEGKTEELIAELQRDMLRASEALEFEQAARIRDQINAVQASLVAQHAVRARVIDSDVVALHREGSAGLIVVARFIEGAMAELQTWPVRKRLLDSPELLSDFLLQYYATEDRRPAPEVLLSDGISEPDALEEWLSELRGTRVRLHVPRRGEKKQLVDLALENARVHFDRDSNEEERLESAAEELQQRLRLNQTPRTLECYDISNLQGTEVVASQVCFVDGRPDKNRYRRYTIQSFVGQDDFAALHEVLTRRAKRARRGDEPLPDLIVIDGGRGQLNAAARALRELGFGDQEIVSLAKSRLKGHDGKDEAQRSAERVFVPLRKDPVSFSAATDGRFLLERIRDEAHRFAITYHRSLRRKRARHSALDEIQGIGKSRKEELLRHFGSLKAIKAASLADLENAPGLGPKTAWAIFDHFHPGESDAPGNEA